MNIVRLCIKWILILIIAVYAVILCMIISASNSRITEKPDVILIPGAAVWKNGPSPVLQSRIEQGCACYQTYPDAVILVSGAQGKNEKVSEAQAMKEVLVKLGVEENQILVEDQSTNTFQNLVYSKKVLTEDGYPEDAQVVIVSSSFHLFRIKMLAKRVGLNAQVIACPNADISSTLKGYLREVPAVIKSWLFDQVWSYSELIFQ